MPWLIPRLKFRGKNPNSMARLEIPQAAENCGPYLLERASFGSCESSRSHTWKRADQKKKDRRKQYSGRRRQMQADADGQADSSLVNVTHSLDNKISPPKFIWSTQPRCWPRPI